MAKFNKKRLCQSSFIRSSAVVIALLACTFASSYSGVAMASTPHQSSFSEGDFLDPSEYAKDENRLTFVLLQPNKTVNVDVSGMEVDYQCVDRVMWSATSNMRTSLIRQGCATLLAGQGNADEQAAQAEVNSRKPSSEPSPTPSEQKQVPNAFNLMDAPPLLLAFVVNEWKYISATILSILGLAAFNQYRLSKRVKVILAGAPAAGKTDFWTALRLGLQPNSNSTPTVGQHTDVLEPVPLGDYKLYPSAVDIAGSQPELVLDELRAAAGLNRWKKKFVLVIVVSPLPGNTSIEGRNFDEAFVEQQMGYMSFPKALIKTKKKAQRPHAVVLFVSKFDLVSPHSATDSAAEAMRDLVHNRFDGHHQTIAGACAETGIPFDFVIGSSKKGWGIEEAKRALWRGVRR